MKLLTLLSFTLTSSLLMAYTDKAPTNFEYKGSTANFIDITTIKTHLTFNIDSKKVSAHSVIEFEMSSEGYPLFDLKPSVESIEVNGLKTNATKIKDPDNQTTYQLVKTKLKAGSHKMEITNFIKENLRFKGDSVSSAFWMSDLSDRKYIEQYIPTNIEFDQYQLSMSIEVKGGNLTEHKVYTNGELSSSQTNHFEINFPEYFTASSFYFHITKSDKFRELEFSFDSISGKKVPVIAYTGSFFQSLETVKKRTLKILKELETKLGAWPHPSLTIYIAGQGGMEHSGATITSMSALGHEITHSYFARGVMPIDGNAGWMDEAIASWRDDGYKAVSRPSFTGSSMSGHSEYRRITDTKAYSQGANFMAFLNKKLDSQGGLTSFLSQFFKKYVHQSVSTETFKKELEIYSGENFSAEFAQYIYGMKGQKKILTSHTPSNQDNPNHPKLSKQDLLDLL